MSDLEVHRLRQAVYRTLSGGFEPISTEFLFATAGGAGVLEELGLFDYAFALEVVDMVTTFGAADPDDLRVAYVRLFEAGVTTAACPLQESAWIGARAGDVARLQSEVRRCCQRLGVPVDESRPDLFDHVSTELGAMSWLCAAAADSGIDDAARHERLRGQLELSEQHLFRWVPRLAESMIRSQAHPAYDALARATLAFVEHERQHLPALVAAQAVGRP